MSARELAFPEDEAPQPAARAETPAESAEAPPARVRIDVPGWVFVKLVLAVLITVALLRFFAQVLSVLLLITLSLVIAAALDPLVGWLERHRVGRSLGAVVAIALVVGGGLAILALVLPPIVIQGIAFAENLPAYIADLRSALKDYPGLFDALERRATGLGANPGALFSRVFHAGVGAVAIAFGIVLLFTLALYFLIEKDRVRTALLRHVRPAYRDRVDRTVHEMARVFRAFSTGQLILSLLFGIYTFVLLTLLGVPYAPVLAALGFFLDAIPNIGSFIATILPALIALTRSSTKAIIVVAAIMTYTQIEINLIKPRLMGERLDVPGVLTIIAIIIGGKLFGIIGVFLSIPLAGALPVIDRIWITGEYEAPASGERKG